MIPNIREINPCGYDQAELCKVIEKLIFSVKYLDNEVSILKKKLASKDKDTLSNKKEKGNINGKDSH